VRIAAATQGSKSAVLCLPISLVLVAFLAHIGRLSGRSLQVGDEGVAVRDKKGNQIGSIHWIELSLVPETYDVAELRVKRRDNRLQKAILVPMQRDEAVINRWSGSARFWEKHREIIRHMFAPITQALVEEAQIGSGQLVLDVATGPGEPTLTLAELVGPQGKISGVDPIPEMVAAARREASRLELRNVQFDIAFADHLPFPADTFDAVVSRFGVMFFPSPLDAVREMLRVLKPGQKLAFAVWHSAERNPFHYSLSRVVDRFVHSPPLEQDALDTFRFAARGKLLEILIQAGVTAPAERLLQFTIHAPMLVDAFWALRLEMSKAREQISVLSPEQLTELKRQALESISEFSTDRGISFPAEVLIISGAKPR
jgi:ubiquinone/menaquinone biosynthesis C-methylase UbiE